MSTRRFLLELIEEEQQERHSNRWRKRWTRSIVAGCPCG